MQSIAEGSALTVYRRFELSPADIALLCAAYLPIAGSEAFSLYSLLCANPSFGPGGELRFGRDLNEILGLGYGKLQLARIRLEGLGLLDTYCKETAAGDEFLLLLNPPKPARRFFADPALKGLLVSHVSARYAQRLETALAQVPVPATGFAKVTATLNTVYGSTVLPTAADDSLLAGLEDKDEDSQGSTFDRRAFARELGNLGYTLKALGEDQERVLSLCGFYGLNPKEAADSVARATASSGLFAYQTFENLCHDRMVFGPSEVDAPEADPFFGSTAAARQFSEMDKLPTPEFICALLKTPTAPTELAKTAHEIATRFGFNRGVVNVIIDYCIRKTGEVPAGSYFEKVALSLVPKKPTNAYETALIFKTGEYKVGKKRKKKEDWEARVLLGAAEAKTAKPAPAKPVKEDPAALAALEKAAKAFGV